MRLRILESALNRNLAASAAARALARSLDGKTLGVRFDAAPDSPLATLYVSCAGECVAIDTQRQGACDAELSGSPLAYLSLLGPQRDDALRGGGVRIAGDAETAQAFRDLLQTARPEFEEELARLIGDLPAHQVSRLARGVLDAGRRIGGVFAQNVAEYLQEESRDLATRIEVDEFNAAVDALRDDSARLEARLAALERAAPPTSDKKKRSS